MSGAVSGAILRPATARPVLEILEVRSDAEAAEAADLMRAFVAWCRERYRERRWQVEAYFQEAQWAAELSSLRQAYAPPNGPLLLARADGAPAGCVALRMLEEGVAEVKRLFVRTELQGLGLGRRLAEAAIARARRRGFRLIRLDSGDLLKEAQALYRALGFYPIAPYYDLPEALRDKLVFMEKSLAASHT